MRLRRPNSIKRRIRKIVSASMIELLDKRIFLSSTYDVPSTGVSSVYLESDVVMVGSVYIFDVYVRQNSSTGTLLTTLSPGSDQSVSIIGHSNGLKLVDQVPAAAKPTGGVKFHMGSGGSNGTIEVDAGDDDDYIAIPSSTSNSATIEVDDNSSDVADDFSGTGVNHITLRTNDNPMADSEDGTIVSVLGLAGGLHLRVDTGDATYNQLYLGNENTIGEQVTVKTGAGNDTVNFETNDGDDGVNALIEFGSGSGNELNVGSAAEVTLTHIDGDTLPIDVDTVSVTGGASYNIATLEVADDATIGDLEVNGFGSVTITASTHIITGEIHQNGNVSIDVHSEGSSTIDTLTVDDLALLDIVSPCTIGTLTIEGEGGGPGVVDIEDSCTIDNLDVERYGDLEVTAPVTITGDLAVDGIVNFYDGVSIDTLSSDDSDGTVSFWGGSTTMTTAEYDGAVLIDHASLTLLTSSTIGDLIFSDDSLVTLQPRSGSPTSSSARVLTFDQIEMGEDDDPVGQLDMNDNDLIVGPDGSSQFSYVRALIDYEWDGGTRDRNGIGSSLAGNYTTLGYAQDSELGSPSSFDGVSIGDGSAVIVKYTWYGDVNLDGTVNASDYSILSSNFGGSTHDWSQGDFNFDGITNGLDFNALATNYGKSPL